MDDVVRGTGPGARSGAVGLLAPCALVTRRPVAPQDLELVRRFFAESREELAVLPPDTRDVLLDMQFRAQRRQYASIHPNARHEILVADGVDVGRLIVDHGTDHDRIVDVTVIRSRRRRGIASTVLRDVMSEADRAGRPVRLSVWSTNAGARRLYEQLGFEVVGDHGGYLELHRAPSTAADR